MRVIFPDCGLAGASYRAAAFDEFERAAPERRQLRLEREPDNKRDPCAVKVIGVWWDKAMKRHEQHLGYLPRPAAAAIAAAAAESELYVQLDTVRAIRGPDGLVKSRLAFFDVLAEP
jgi:hypothetical protein